MVRKFTIALAVTGGLAACQDDNPVVQTESGPRIQIVDGVNCYNKQCFSYGPNNGSLVVAGRFPTTVQAGITSASVSEFQAMYARGRAQAQRGDDN